MMTVNDIRNEGFTVMNTISLSTAQIQEMVAGTFTNTGFTRSSNFPLANAFDNTFGGGTCGSSACYDAFVTHLDIATNTLVYSSYLGGSSEEQGSGITVDSSGDAYVTGYSKSTDFPTLEAVQPTKGADSCSAPPCSDAFVVKVSATGNPLIYSTYLGGSDEDYGNAITQDGLGGAYITGYTFSSNFPTTSGAYDMVIGSSGYSDAFVAKIFDPLSEPPTLPLTIDYTYDALHRPTSAIYSDGRSFSYTYDPAGNVLELGQNLGPGTIITTYAYDAANQLNTAQEGSTTWNYTYDANGSLISDGVKTYTYNSANRLIGVNDGSSVTSLTYNGLGQRLSMDAAGVIAHYVLDTSSPLSAGSDLPLTATSSGNTTFFLYGRGPIGEKTSTWNYSLLDGTNTPRQLTAANGDVTLSTRYTPWGDTLELNGTGNFTFGYIGGILDVTTGLLYVGNGQYYDPSTGRFLTRDVNPDSPNPYVPWNPTGAILGPLGVLSLVAMRRRGKRNKNEPYFFLFIMLVVLPLSVGMACDLFTPAPPPVTPTQPVVLATTPGPTTVAPVTSTPTAPVPSPTSPCQDCTPTSAPTNTPTPTVEQELRDLYGVILENGNMLWSADQMNVVLTAIRDIANRFGSVSTFRVEFNVSDSSPIRIIRGTSSSHVPEIIAGECETIVSGGCTSPNKVINFASLLPNGGYPETARNNVVHEMGHVFNNEHGGVPEADLDAHPEDFVDNRNLILRDNSVVQWQLNTARTANETFADFFLAWTYNEWRPLTDANGITKAGIAKAWMDANMPNW